MMKWIISLILAVLSWNSQPLNPENISPTVITPQSRNPDVIVYKDIRYNYLFTEAVDPDRIFLISNLKRQQSAKQITSEYHCQIGINGGFYDNNLNAIGLFRIKGETLTDQKSSQIFNGYISIDNKVLQISSIVPVNSFFALQTGPMLIIQNKVQSLSMARDKAARRMIFAKTSRGKAVFLAVYTPNAVLLGPQLTDLPEIVSIISNKENLQIESAINLDGGSASAFFDGYLKLEEVQPVGSWWCVNVE